ncbi:hypothetical protein ILYODFUR_004850 [Ilyodon furcidens]|uniref:Uncharacterized protein n=1 Tax=Ilyodon furcidens TaxID=33524 RepID=A0ABV0SIJ1_9TELE
MFTFQQDKNPGQTNRASVEWLHGGAVGSTVALQQESPEFDSQPGDFVHILAVHACVCMVFCVLPCDGLVTCPGCTLPPTHRLLEIGTSFPTTHYGRNGIEDD